MYPEGYFSNRRNLNQWEYVRNIGDFSIAKDKYECLAPPGSKFQMFDWNFNNEKNHYEAIIC